MKNVVNSNLSMVIKKRHHINLLRDMMSLFYVSQSLPTKHLLQRLRISKQYFFQVIICNDFIVPIFVFL